MKPVVFRLINVDGSLGSLDTEGITGDPFTGKVLNRDLGYMLLLPNKVG